MSDESTEAERIVDGIESIGGALWLRKGELWFSAPDDEDKWGDAIYANKHAIIRILKERGSWKVRRGLRVWNGKLRH